MLCAERSNAHAQLRRREKRGKYADKDGGKEKPERYTRQVLRSVGNFDPAVRDIGLRVPDEAQMGGLGQPFCDNLYKIWCHIRDGDGEAFDRWRRG